LKYIWGAALHGRPHVFDGRASKSLDNMTLHLFLEKVKMIVSIGYE
jgi:hypothetical protein